MCVRIEQKLPVIYSQFLKKDDPHNMRIQKMKCSWFMYKKDVNNLFSG